MQLSNNTILITGGTSGFGLQFASQLLDLGNTVIITGRDAAKLEQTKKQLPKVHIFQSDVSDPIAIARLFDDVVSQFPRLNILINNAGELRKINLQDPSTDLENVTREITINLMGPIRMIQQFLPQLKKQSAAAILNVTSGLALVPFPIAPIYGATKAGLHSYTKSLRVQLKNTGIKVFELIAPAASTPLNDKFANMDGMNEKMMMAPDKVVNTAIKGMQQDKFTVYPGMAKLLNLMSRLAPRVIFKQLSKVGSESFYQ